MKPKVFPLDLKRSYSLELRNGSTVATVNGRPLDEHGTRWFIEGVGELEARVGELYADTEHTLEFRAAVQFEVVVRSEVVRNTERADKSFLMPDDERLDVLRSIDLWAKKPESKVHRIIAIVVSSPGGMPRYDLVKRVQKFSQNASGAVASLLTSAGNAYGRALIDDDGIISVHPDVRDRIAQYRWSI